MVDFSGLSNISVFAGGAFTLLIGIFALGYNLNAKIKYTCSEELKGVSAVMLEFSSRLDKLEAQAVPLTRYERDLSDLKTLIREIKTEVQQGLATVSGRIDNLIIAKTGV